MKKWKTYVITRRIYLAESIDIEDVVIARSKDEALDVLESPGKSLAEFLDTLGLSDSTTESLKEILKDSDGIIEDHSIINVQVNEKEIV